MAKDKEKVIDEVWTEARIAEFLDVKPAAGIDADFHALQKAYQAMRAEDFEIFIGLFKGAGRNLNARDPQGRTLLSYVREHRNSAEFARILEQNGAE
jgi:aryl-alcohol dehydrogenase-like predicted oxidoreductase